MPVNLIDPYVSDMHQKPGNLCHNAANARALSNLISDDSIKNLASFASGKQPANLSSK
jgi:hypothetical protein